jgi:hypothetical protein
MAMKETLSLLARAGAVSTFACLAACGGRYEVRDGATTGNGAAGGSMGGSTSASAGAGDASGNGGTGGASANGGSGGASANAGSSNSAFVACTKKPTEASMLTYGTPAAPNVVIDRITLFLHDNQPGFSVRAPDVITPDWTAQAITADFDSPLADPSSALPGITRFMHNWLEVGADGDGQTAVSQGALAFNDPTMTYPLLLAPKTGASILVDTGLARLRPEISGRGAFMLSSLFCTTVGTHPDMPSPLGTGSPRQQLVMFTDQPTCQVCHSLIDPLGFSLIGLDIDTGEISTNGGYWNDSSGNFKSPGDPTFAEYYTFGSILDLEPELAASCEVARCFATSYVNEATTTLGLPALPNDELEFVITQFSKSNFSLQALVGAFVQTPTFLQ